MLFIDDLLDGSSNSVPGNREPLKKKLMRDLAKATLFSYILLVLNPVMPVVADKIAHTFWEKYHLLTVHEINGKFHVHMEMAKAATQSEKDKSAPNSQSDLDEYVHLITNISYDFSNNYFVRISYLPCTITYPVVCPDIHYHPPKA